jgi:hypothetical protein
MVYDATLGNTGLLAAGIALRFFLFIFMLHDEAEPHSFR